jgi:hypothetical protein
MQTNGSVIIFENPWGDTFLNSSFSNMTKGGPHV